MKILLKILLFIILTTGIVVSGCFLYYATTTANVELDETKLNSAPLTCTVYYSDGSIIENNNRSTYESLTDLPENLKNAFIAIEDKRFYTHNGIDARAMLRALKNNIAGGKLKEGASTITQQLVKNTYLSGEKTLNRKLKEIKLARLLEKKYTKDQILEKYLNKIYFGEGAYGVGSAAGIYFDKNVKDLTLAECAMLAATIKAPSKYNPYGYYDKCMSRKNLVLSEMLSQNFISEEEYVSATAQKIVLSERKNGSKEKNGLTDEIVNEALELLNLTSSSDLNGYKIYTDIKKDLQNRIPTAQDYSLNNDYTTLIVDNATGKIIGYRSSVGQLKRCPASSAKPWLIYAPAIESNLICEATKLLDEKTNFGGYSPSNYGDKYYGYVSAKFALAKSLNVPSVKLAETLGSATIRSYAKKLGIEYSNDDLSVGLGNLSGGITLSQLVSAYSPFSNDGNFKKIGFITEIISSDGKKVWSDNNIQEKVFSSATSYIINDMLYETAKKGTAKKLSELNFKICAKTGTNGDKNGNTDAYCVAYTPEYTVATWFGNADERKMSNNISGGTYPTESVCEVFINLYKNSTPTEFNTIPEDVLNIKIDKLSYEKEHKILLANDNSEYLEFLFKRGSEPAAHAENKALPELSYYSIVYKDGKIIIDIAADDKVFYTITDKYNSISLNGNGNKIFELKNLKSYTIYNLIIQPYIIGNTDKLNGEQIKLPSVKTDAKSNPVTEWWEDN